MHWALIAHPEQFIRGRLVVPPKAIAEACVPAAVAQGWIVLARDSTLMRADLPMQRSPNRLRRRDHGYGHTEEY